MSAQELCKKLKINPDENDFGGYYNALNRSIGYLSSDEENEIEKFFRINHDMTNPSPNDDVYEITEQGKKYMERSIKAKLLFIFVFAVIIVACILSFLLFVKNPTLV